MPATHFNHESLMTRHTMSRTFATIAFLLLPAAVSAQSTGAMTEKGKMEKAKKDADAMGKMDSKSGDKMGKMDDKMGSAMGAMDDGMTAPTFRGVGDHQAAGTYTISSTKQARQLTTSKDFVHDPRATDVRLLLAKGNMGTPKNGLLLGRVERSSGVNVLAIPADATLEQYDTIILWSTALNTAVGTARFDGAALARR